MSGTLGALVLISLDKGFCQSGVPAPSTRAKCLLVKGPALGLQRLKVILIASLAEGLAGPLQFLGELLVGQLGGTRCALATLNAVG